MSDKIKIIGIILSVTILPPAFHRSAACLITAINAIRKNFTLPCQIRTSIFTLVYDRKWRKLKDMEFNNMALNKNPYFK